MKKISIYGMITLLAIILSGCPDFLGTPLLIEYEVDEIVSSDENLGSAYINLEDDDDFAEHQDEIVAVDHVFIGAVIVNNSGHAVSGELYYSVETMYSADEVRNGADLLYTSPDIPDQDTLRVSFQPDISTGFDHELMAGQFRVYGIGNQDDFDVEVEAEIKILFYYNPNESEE